MDFSRTYLKEQSNKQHKGLNVKLEKRRQTEKERKIKKKTKKIERSGKAVKYHQAFKESIKGVNFHRLKRQVDLFKDKFPNEIDDLVHIANFMDQGKKIDIKDIENSESKILIENIFEILGITGKDQVFSKGNLDFSCKDAIMMAMKKRSCEEDHSDDDIGRKRKNISVSSSNSDLSQDDESEEDEPQLRKLPLPKKAIVPQERLIETPKPKPTIAPVMKHPIVEKIPVKKPQFVKNNQFVEEQRNQPVDRLTAFVTQSTYQNYDKKLGTSTNKHLNEIDEDGDEKNKKMQLYFDNYDKINRPKTLLEQHREKLQAKNSVNDSSKQPMPNKDKTEKLFSIVNNERFSIQKNFSEAKFKNSFM